MYQQSRNLFNIDNQGSDAPCAICSKLKKNGQNDRMRPLDTALAIFFFSDVKFEQISYTFDQCDTN